MKTWEIYHYTYGNVCEDDWYGKTSKRVTLGYVTDSEENIKALVNRLNKKNRSYYAKTEPEDIYDNDFVDEDYIDYVEFKVSSIEEIEANFR